MAEADFSKEYLSEICSDGWKSSIKRVIGNQLMYFKQKEQNGESLLDFEIETRILESIKKWQTANVKPEYRTIELHRLRNLLQIITHMMRPNRKIKCVLVGVRDNYKKFVEGCQRALETTNNSIRCVTACTNRRRCTKPYHIYFSGQLMYRKKLLKKLLPSAYLNGV